MYKWFRWMSDECALRFQDLHCFGVARGFFVESIRVDGVLYVFTYPGPLLRHPLLQEEVQG
jgi:hypothetical protein